MTDLLQTGSDWLADQLKTNASREVTYRRSVASVAVQATIGRTIFETDDGSGLIVKSEVRDYLIQTAELLLAGDPVEPAKGDRIEEVDGTVTYIYEVASVGTEPCWRYSDPYRKLLRIHTRLIGVQTA